MSGKITKKSIRDFFAPKVSKEKTEVIEVEEVTEGETGEEIADGDALSCPGSPPPAPQNGRTPGGRPTRACANRARLAWNGKCSGSSDEDEDFVRGGRKRGRPSKGGKRGNQTTISINGTLLKQVKDDEEKASFKKKKRKLEHDPDREAFLRSGVPDVIKRAKAKNNNKKKDIDNDSDEDIVIEKVEEKRRTLDPETIAFLQSGVPTSVIKARQTVDKKKEEDDFLTTMGFFPKTTHVGDILDNHKSDNASAIDFPFRMLSTQKKFSEPDEALLAMFSFSSLRDSTSETKCFCSQESYHDSPVDLCCDEFKVTLDSQESLSRKISDAKCCNGDSDTQMEYLPWIELMKVTKAKKLVVDRTSLERLTEWLKQWRKDIRDDGGTSRKIEKKRKKGGNSSGSDFVTSDEEESEMKKKSVLLTGPSGCGKTAAIYVLAKQYDFEVVEVNFSSRRSGKDVMQRVEEAVLSHRLKSTKNCLLLFKDIDLLHQEDEGFFSAVAQLITTAVRPIVMTSSLPHYFPIDSKLDKKDPMRITFSLPRPNEIVENVLKPILSSAKIQMHSKSEAQLDKWLDSIVRHSNCDIRQCINQLQLLLSSSSDFTCLSNEAIHLYSSPFQRHLIDLNFPRQSTGICADSLSSSQGSNNDDDDINISLSARNKRSLRQLNGLVSNLEIFSDLDWISRISPSCPTRNVNIFGDIDEAIWHWNHVSGMRSPFFARLSARMDKNKRENSLIDTRSIRMLVLESDAEIDKCVEIDELNDEIGQYLDVGVGNMGGNWECCAAVRTIVKNNVLDSVVGRNQKRGGRMASYFNRIDRSLRDRITRSFDFQKQLNAVKLS